MTRTKISGFSFSQKARRGRPLYDRSFTGLDKKKNECVTLRKKEGEKIENGKVREDERERINGRMRERRKEMEMAKRRMRSIR